MEQISEKRRFAAAYLKCFDAQRAAAEVGREDGVRLLEMPGVKRELELQRGQCDICRRDVLRRLAQLAFGSFCAEDAATTLVIALLAFGLNVIELPVMFRFGVEKGRLVFLLLTCGGVSAILVGQEQFLAALDRIENPAAMLLVVAGAVAALTAVSLPLAVRMYRSRYRK